MHPGVPVLRSQGIPAARVFNRKQHHTDRRRFRRSDCRWYPVERPRAPSDQHPVGKLRDGPDLSDHLLYRHGGRRILQHHVRRAAWHGRQRFPSADPSVLHHSEYSPGHLVRGRAGHGCCRCCLGYHHSQDRKRRHPRRQGPPQAWDHPPPSRPPAAPEAYRPQYLPSRHSQRSVSRHDLPCRHRGAGPHEPDGRPRRRDIYFSDES